MLTCVHVCVCFHLLLINPNVGKLGLGCSTLSLSVHVTRWVDGWNDATKIGLELTWKCFWKDL